MSPLSGAGQPRADAPSAPSALSEFFKPGVVFQDRNGDGAIDFVDARIVLPEQPSAAELAAAADIAARLGYETSAMNLPVAVARGFQPADSPTIFVGAKSLAGSRTTLESIGVANLKAGEGAVAAFSQGGHAGRRRPRRRRQRHRLGRGDARRSPAVRLGSEESDHRQDRRRSEAVPERQGRHRFVGDRVRDLHARRQRRRRRSRGRRTADGERRRFRQGDGRAEPVQGDQRARSEAAAVVRERARAADRGCARPAPGRSRSICRERRFRRRRRPQPPARRPGGAREGEFRSLELLRQRRRARRHATTT